MNHPSSSLLSMLSDSAPPIGWPEQSAWQRSDGVAAPVSERDQMPGPAAFYVPVSSGRDFDLGAPGHLSASEVHTSLAGPFLLLLLAAVVALVRLRARRRGRLRRSCGHRAETRW